MHMQCYVSTYSGGAVSSYFWFCMTSGVPVVDLSPVYQRDNYILAVCSQEITIDHLYVWPFTNHDQSGCCGVLESGAFLAAEPRVVATGKVP